MDIKKEKAVINEENLDAVTGGITAPELPATTLEKYAYNGMFSIPTNPCQYEPHSYNNNIVDPTYIIKESSNE